MTRDEFKARLLALIDERVHYEHAVRAEGEAAYLWVLLYDAVRDEAILDTVYARWETSQ